MPIDSRKLASTGWEPIFLLRAAHAKAQREFLAATNAAAHSLEDLEKLARALDSLRAAGRCLARADAEAFGAGVVQPNPSDA